MMGCVVDVRYRCYTVLNEDIQKGVGGIPIIGSFPRLVIIGSASVPEGRQLLVNALILDMCPSPFPSLPFPNNIHHKNPFT